MRNRKKNVVVKFSIDDNIITNKFDFIYCNLLASDFKSFG